MKTIKLEELKYKNRLYYYNNEPFTGKAVDGTQFYLKNGLLHREDGPAIIYPDGRQYYCKNGLLHREDGPAIIYPDGTQSYFKNGGKIKLNIFITKYKKFLLD